MAKTKKDLLLEIKKDSEGNVTARYYLTVGSDDDASLSKTVIKDCTLSAGDQTDADSLYASLETEAKSDESIS